MIFISKDFTISKKIPADVLKKDTVCFAKSSEKADILPRFEPAMMIQKMDSTAFESRKDYDYISITLPDLTDELEELETIEIYYADHCLLFFCENHPAIDSLLQEFSNKSEESLILEKVLNSFFVRLLSQDGQVLENIEEAISDLEDDIADDKLMNYNTVISSLRKQLLKLKRYYESLIVLLEGLEENQNRLLSKEQLRWIHFQTNKAERLFHSVVSLRDYVTQVRESYQAQLDLSLNQTMKLFTVSTAIFLPLSLIAGWYGMNLAMPEYASPYAYPILIGVSLMIIIACIVYFKKKQWF